MKKLFTFLFALSLVAATHAQGTLRKASDSVVTSVKPAVAVPENVLVLKETEFDFGKIPQGKPVTHIFEFWNKSNVPLKIANVQASCGCTTPEWEKDKEVPAGESSKITVGYNAAAEGPFTKFITISYNETQTKQITIKGEVWKTPATSAPENKSINDLKN